MRGRIYFNTSGDGLWSQRRARVLVTDMILADADSGELRVHFDVKTWNVDNDGLIYTDQQWLVELKNYFRVVERYSARAIDDITYSEQGMQSQDYVSLDVGPEFVREWTLSHDIKGTYYGA